MPASDDEPWRNPGFEEPPAAFRGPTQRARWQTEGWVAERLFCPNCTADRLNPHVANRPVADFWCGTCGEDYELKAAKSAFGAKVVDGAYAAMMARLAAPSRPNLILMRYTPAPPSVRDLILVPAQFFSESLIEERPPTWPKGRSAPWIGCNIRIGDLPDEGRIRLWRDGAPTSREHVRETWRRSLFLRSLRPDAQGWLLEVWKAVQAIGAREFTLADVYAHEARLAAAFPGNNNVRPKIRQQLQVLRDHGLLAFDGGGRYRRL